MFWKKRDTDIRERFFAMTLPGKWNRLFDEPEMRWNFDTSNEQITVSYLLYEKPLSDSEQSDLLHRYVELRRKAEAEGTDAPVQLSDVVFAGVDGVRLARYEGIEEAAQRLFACLVFVQPGSLATFYYEAIGLAYSEFENRGRFAFNSIKPGRS